jgi:hypothetical protein
MRRRFLQSLRIVALTGGICAVGFAAFASGDYAFSPPTGWAKLASGTNMKWADPAGTEFVALHPTTFYGDLNAFVNAMLKKEKTANPTQYVWANKNYLICGRHTGRYVIWTSTAHGHTSIWEQMFALWGQDGYAVTYVRPQNLPPSTVARAALVSICGVGEGTEPVGGVPVTLPKAAPAEPAPDTETIVQPTPAPTGTIPHPYVPVIPQ